MQQVLHQRRAGWQHRKGQSNMAAQVLYQVGQHKSRATPVQEPGATGEQSTETEHRQGHQELEGSCHKAQSRETAPSQQTLNKCSRAREHPLRPCCRHSVSIGMPQTEHTSMVRAVRPRCSCTAAQAGSGASGGGVPSEGDGRGHPKCSNSCSSCRQGRQA